MDLRELAAWEGDLGEHWYYASKACALEKLLHGIEFCSIADIGAGSGFFSKHLLTRRQSACTATCVDIHYDRERDEAVAHKVVSYRKTLGETRADLYLLMDVLEHVEEDQSFLKSVVDGAPQGAYFVISVPAFQFLWSRHDVFLGHFRRYSLSEIGNVAAHAGLTIRTSCYYFGAVFPVAAAMRLIQRLVPAPAERAASDMRPVPRVVNSLLRWTCKAEERVFMMNRAFGLTAFVLASVPPR